MKYYTKMVTNILLASLTVIISLEFPILILPGIIATYNFAKNALNGAIKNDIKDSCFEVIKDKKNSKTHEKNDVISQSVFMAKDFIMSGLEQNHSNYFNVQTMNMFEQLPKERKGKNIVYSCTSQSYTKYLLRGLEKRGFITNLQIEKSDKHMKLKLVRWLFRVKQREKEIKMFDMSFELTDKKFDGQSALDMAKRLGINMENYVPKQKKDLILFKPNFFKLVANRKKQIKNDENEIIYENNISDLSPHLPEKMILEKENNFSIQNDNAQEIEKVKVEKDINKDELISQLKNLKQTLLEMSKENDNVESIDNKVR